MKDIVNIFESLQQKHLQSKTFAHLNQTYSYAQLLSATYHLGGVFAANHLKEGDRIIISSKDHFAISSIVLASFRFGITVILMDSEMGSIRAKELIKICQPKGFFIDKALINKWELSEASGFVFKLVQQKKKRGALFKKILKSKNKVDNNEDLPFQNVITQYPITEFPTSIRPETIAYILFTSGTTATPKAVQISHKALWANLDTIVRVYELEASSNIFNILTTYHVDGIIQGPVLAALTNSTWYHPMEFAVDQITPIFDMMYRYRISHFITVPTMLAFLLKFSEGFEDSFSSEDFKYIITSASPFELKLWQDFEATFNTKVVNNYGLTETVAGTSYCGPDTNTRKVGTIGKPIDCEFKIIDEAGNTLEENQKGELLIKGENTLTNYLNNEEATLLAIQDGWFYTGDIAIRDEEGFYTLVGRKKNLVICGGINIQPEEVSEVINTHPMALESVCLGVPDEIFGEILIACVVKEPHSTLDELQIITHCRSQLETAKLPKRVYFLDRLPKTVSGKIKLQAVRELLFKDKANETKIPSSSLQEGIFSSASDAFRLAKDKLDLNSSTENLDGWDSMAHLVFITNLEEHFNIRLSSKEIMIMNSLREAEKVLTKKVS